jgi:hypothetical protein
MVNKRYWYYGYKVGGEVELFTPDEAKLLVPAKLKGESVWIERLHRALDTKFFTDFEESDRVYYGGSPDQLEAGDRRPGSEIPIPGRRGGVAVCWVKRRIRSSNFKDYKGRPGYYPLRKDEDSATMYVVFARPVYPSGLPDDLQELEDFEVEIIEKRLANRAGWWSAA